MELKKSNKGVSMSMDVENARNLYPTAIGSLLGKTMQQQLPSLLQNHMKD